MIELLPYFIVALIYSFVAIDFWRAAKIPTAVATLRWHSVAIAVGLMLHGWLLYGSLFNGGLNLGFANALSAIFWLTVLIYWLTDLRLDLHTLQAFVLPPTALFVLLQQ